MVSYAYKGVDRKGVKVEGQISAPSLMKPKEAFD